MPPNRHCLTTLILELNSAHLQALVAWLQCSYLSTHCRLKIASPERVTLQLTKGKGVNLPTWGVGGVETFRLQAWSPAYAA